MLKHIIKSGFILFLLGILSGFFWDNISWEKVNAQIDRKHPSIISISTEELLQSLNSGTLPVVFDVRSKKEFEISRIPGALHATKAKDIELAKDTPIVAYCSVGVRSADFIEKLRKRGYTQIKNLRGSIFEWANKGYPLIREMTPVFTVHPYNQKWGRLLDSKRHQYKLEE